MDHIIHIPFKKMTLCAILVGILFLSGQGICADDARVTFGVGWYDVGQAVLEGRQGIKQVTKGWKGSMEINTVNYDPSEISIEDMEKALKKSGTYKKTMKGQ